MSTTPYKSRTIDPNTPVQLYRNLHKEGVCFSVKQRGLVVAHTTSCQLRDAVFKVDEKGRQEVISSKRKRVHAVVEGYWRDRRGYSQGCRVSYNPYRHGAFVSSKGDMHQSNIVSFSRKGVFAK